jgi:chemotaxis protein MotB
MSDDSDDEAPAGAPMWMATFADLMSLLMCFFVLILSFSEMDVLKYKQIADSMRDAFGVQRKVKVEDIPRGTSIIATDFSPGKPEPTVLDVVQQMTTNEEQQSLRTGNPDAPQSQDQFVLEMQKQQFDKMVRETAEAAATLTEVLDKEIESGQVDVEHTQREITIRIREKGSFPSGSSGLDVSFLNVLARIADSLVEIDGQIAVEGHTDNIPIRTAAYPSNWALSASRAVEVAQRLMAANPRLSPERFTVTGHADTQPQADNDTWEGRAANRRVEIILRQPIEETLMDSANALRATNTAEE